MYMHTHFFVSVHLNRPIFLIMYHLEVYVSLNGSHSARLIVLMAPLSHPLMVTTFLYLLKPSQLDQRL